MIFFFGFTWLLHCIWFFFSCKWFMLGVNKIRCETSMLDLKNAFVICFLFLFFIDFISFGEFYVSISFGVWVGNPYIWKCHLTCLPEPTSTDIKCGSTSTSLQTFFNSIDVIFVMWLYRKEAKPPFLEERVCWTSNLLPHSQFDGTLVSVHPYLIRIRSQNNCLVKS